MTVWNFYNQFQILYDSIVNKHHLSEYNSDTLKFYNNYFIGPINGYLQGIDKNKSYNQLDIQKCYTSCIADTTILPVFQYFDRFLKYNNEPIENYNFYIIIVKTKNYKTNNCKFFVHRCVVLPHRCDRTNNI